MIDWFSPPIMMGTTYLLLFGIGIIDAEFFDDRTRLRAMLLYYRGLSLAPILYLAASLASFMVGYYLTPVGPITRRLRPLQREWVPHRASVVGTLFFLATFGVLGLYTITVGYGRYEGSGNEALSNLSLLGELSMIPCVFSLVRYMQYRAKVPGVQMSRWDLRFLWGVMLPLQLAISIFIGVRSRAVLVVLTVVSAYHYLYKPIRPRSFGILGAVLLFVAMPLLEYLRPDAMLLPGESGSYAVRAWQSVAGRTSSIETFTVIYENLDRVPEPDPIYWALTSGLIPRFLWPSKPIANFSERLTFWAVGQRELAWMGPTLPGELLILLGHAGALLFMLALGALWRVLKEISRIGEPGAWIALYLVILRTLQTVEIGFVIPYSTLTRFLAVTILLLLITTAPVGRRVTARRPMLVNPGRFRRTALGAS
ncbi:MAG: hypothetical protein HY824_11550 [Acidobacteria bacterium]|nr:hypothetical protein [Acidobacteriota bacterium]